MSMAVFSQTVEMYVSEGDFYHKVSDYNRALECYKNALDIQISQSGENHIFVLALYNRIGAIYYEQKNLEAALHYFSNSLNICILLFGDDNQYLPDIYYYLFGIYYDMGDYKKAVYFGEKSLSLDLKYYDPEDERVLDLNNTLALSYLQEGNFNNALTYAQKALNLAEKFLKDDTYNLPTFYDNVGGVYNEKGDYEAAFKYFSKALNLRLKNESDYLGLAFSYNNLGLISVSQNDFDNAIKFYFLAIENYEKLNFTENPYIATVYSNIANCYNIQKKFNDADIYNKKSLELREKYLGTQHPETAISYSNIAWNFYDQNDIANAISFWKKSYGIWKTSTDYNNMLLRLREIVFIENHDPDFLRETLTLATDTVERARLDISSLKDDIFRQSLPIYYYGVQFESEQKNPKKAFEYSESLRSRGFLDQIGTEAALKLDGVTDEEREQIHSLTSEITAARKMIEVENSKTIDERDEKRLSEAGKNLSEAEKVLASLDKKIGKRIPAYSQLRNPLPVSASDAQKWCGKKRAVLEYVLWNPELTDNKDAKLKSYCLVLTDKKITVVELDGEYDYTIAINKLRNGITGLKRESQFEGVRNELYEKLISPVLPYVGSAKELVIVPDGNLSFLPFDVLRKDDSSKVLGDKYAIALSPSVSVSVLCDKYSVSARKMLAFGGAWYDTSLSPDAQRRSFTEWTRGVNRGALQTDFTLDEMNEKQLTYVKRDIQQNGPANYFAQKKLNWQNLPGTLTELSSISSLFKQEDFTEITQENAAEYNVKELSTTGELSKYGILHFACHGYFDKSLAEMSSVLFSEVSGKLSDLSQDDGYLTIGEAAVLNLNADIVCLSACETGLGEIKAGDGIVGLSRAFMVAGAKHVGASLWCVDDTATAKFMSSMYKKVTKGMDYITAYQKTKAEFRKDEDFSHPYYWSAFVLYE